MYLTRSGEQDVIFCGILQHRGERSEACRSARAACEFFCHLLQNHGLDFAERQTVNIRVRHFQHFSECTAWDN